MDESTSIPSPLAILKLEAPTPSFILKVLDENIRYTLDGLFSLIPTAYRRLKRSLTATAEGLELDRVFVICPGDPPILLPDMPPHSLRNLFESIMFRNAPPVPYPPDCELYLHLNGEFHKYPASVQQRTRRAIEKLKGLHYYLDHIDNFWSAKHELYGETNKTYIASVFATQLQCANTIKLKDKTLSLSSVALLALLASPGTLSNAHVYRVSFMHREQDIYIPLAGVFLIARYPEDTHESHNPCVLYVPGSQLQQFDSLDLLKAHLAAEPNSETRSRFSACIAQHLYPLLDEWVKTVPIRENEVILEHVKFDQYFFSDRIQELIDKEKQDMIHTWSRAHFPPSLPTPSQNWVPWYSISTKPFEFFDITLQNALAVEKETGRQRHEIKQTADINPALLPIKIHAMLHRDLEESGHTFESVRDRIFSWLVTELETLSHRRVELIQIESKAAPTLYDFNYVTTSHFDSINRWEEAVKHALATTLQSSTELDKFLLLTHNDVHPFGAKGVASGIPGQYAIASTEIDRIAGHEVGHLLGATHQDGDLIYEGWWKETLMRVSDISEIPNTAIYRFSDKNRQNIKKYLDQFD